MHAKPLLPAQPALALLLGDELGRRLRLAAPRAAACTPAKEARRCGFHLLQQLPQLELQLELLHRLLQLVTQLLERALELDDLRAPT